MIPGIPSVRCVYTAVDPTWDPARSVPEVHPPAGSTPVASRRELAYRSLKARLLAGDFLPGVRLGEERLAAEVGVSRTPVREALSRLHTEGLLERLEDGGYGPTLVDLHLVRELYEIRFALERAALGRHRRGAPPHDRATLEALRDDWTALNAPGEDTRSGDTDARRVDGDSTTAADGQFVLIDEDFHERLAAAAGNAALVVQLHNVNERIRLVRMHDFLTADRVTRTVEQHLSVLEPLFEGDLAEADARLVSHFEESLAVAGERAALTIARMIGRRRS